VDFEDGIIKLPKIGKVKAIIHKQFKGIMKVATFSKSCTGKYYLSILVEDNK
jgi:putative transposase